MGGGHGRQDFASETFVTHSLRGGGFDASEDGTGRGMPLVSVVGFNHRLGGDKTTSMVVSDKAPTMDRTGAGAVLSFEAVQVTSKTNRSNPQPGDPSHPLAAGPPPTIAFHNRQDPDSGPVTHPLGAKDNGLGIAQSGARVRRLTPVECERLQGFPDGYTAIPGAKDGPRYRAIGNSMAVPVMHWLGGRIAFVDALCRALSAQPSDCEGRA